MSNRQLKMMTELVFKASRDTPDIEWDDLLARLTEMCQFRGMTMTVLKLSGTDQEELDALPTPEVKAERIRAANLRSKKPVPPAEVSRAAVHPLFRDGESGAA